jgi:multicomponent Na+:H+ antiporter subunit F
MTGFEWPLALFLLANLVPALVLTQRGQDSADPMLMALLFGTTGVGILVLLAYAGGQALIDLALVDVALVLALLAAISGIAFARRAWHGQEKDHD